MVDRRPEISEVLKLLLRDNTTGLYSDDRRSQAVALLRTSAQGVTAIPPPMPVPLGEKVSHADAALVGAAERETSIHSSRAK